MDVAVRRWRTAPAGRRAWLIALLSLAVLIALGAAILLSGTAPGGRFGTRAGNTASAGRPPPVPRVEEVTYFPLPADNARAINASIPFVQGETPPARPFVFPADDVQRERALTCLAAVAFYEAGDDPIGQQAVVQVVLNRARHPAFPKSVCGVVFQGSERRTGCQFTFTCDGALMRRPSPEAWARARGVAEKALGGAVYAPVGNATHYHTDWVLPRWSPEMDKIIEVHTHLFFRWRGWWGQPGAMRGVYAGPENLDPRIAWLSKEAPALGGATISLPPGLADDATVTARPVIAGMTEAQFKGNAVRAADDETGVFFLALDPAAFPGSYAVVAWRMCADRFPCRVLGWRNPTDVPKALPLTEPARSSLGFEFAKSADGIETTRWNCRQMPRSRPDQCLPETGKIAPPATPAATK